MRFLIIIIMFSVILVAAACAPKKPLTYDAKNSKALNIVKAAGMEYGLKDVTVPKDTVSDIRHSSGYGAAYALAGFSAPVPGISSLSAAGLNIVAWALQPKSPSARNSVIAWMPEDIGGDREDKAAAKMSFILIEATEKAARDLGYSPAVGYHKVKQGRTGIVISLTDNNSEHCKLSTFPGDTTAYCNIVYKVRHPQKNTDTVHFVGNGVTWFFDPVASEFTAMMLDLKDKRMSKYNQLELLIATSKHLPEWVYFYLAPGEVKISEKEKIKVPMILNKGEIHYFIKALEN